MRSSIFRNRRSLPSITLDSRILDFSFIRKPDKDLLFLKFNSGYRTYEALAEVDHGNYFNTVTSKCFEMVAKNRSAEVTILLKELVETHYHLITDYDGIHFRWKYVTEVKG